MREHDTPLETAAELLLLLQAYTHVTGDILPATELAERLERLAAYLLWTDREGNGFASTGVPDTTEEGGAPIQIARKRTYPAMIRLAALRAAGGLLEKVGWHEEARRFEQAAEDGARDVDRQAWLDDHYATSADRSAVGIVDARTGDALAFEDMPGWDAYSILTGDGMLLPAMIGQPLLLDRQRLAADIYNAMRECVTPYGCSRNSAEPSWVSIGQNLWRDLLGQYLGMDWPPFLSQRYWDLQVVGNTHDQTRGFVDSYITDDRGFSPRGAVTIGYLLAQPRLVIDRLAPGGERISVEPVKTTPQRWPLFALADWRAGKIPICVVDLNGRVSIEGETDPIIIRGSGEAQVIG
jgi:hypothetical protein